MRELIHSISVQIHDGSHKVLVRVHKMLHNKPLTHYPLCGVILFGLAHNPHAGVEDWAFLVLAILCEIPERS